MTTEERGGSGASRALEQAPAGRARKRGRHRRAALALAGVLVALAALAACSTARQRTEPEGPLSLLHFRDADTYRYFTDTYRTGTLYVDFRPALIVDAIAKDRTYRRLYVDMLAEQYLLPPAEVRRLQDKQEEAFRTGIELVVLVYEGTRRPPTNLAKGDALWRLYLRDDDGQLLAPAQVRRVGEDSTEYAYLEQYFYGLDRWSRVYTVRFPKLSKGVLGQPPGTEPMELIVTGIPGRVVLRWADPTLFYATTPAPG